MMTASPELNLLCTQEMNQVRGEEGIDATHMSAERPARQEQDLDHKSLKVPFDESDCKVTP